MAQPRTILVIIASVALACPAASPAAQGKTSPASASASDDAPLDVNITSDSAPDWVPPEQLVLQAVKTVEDYFKALDAGDYPRAYAMITPDNQRETPATRFRDEGRKFNELAGRLRRRRVLTSTWSKNPPAAPRPGIYAAFDLAAQFTNVDRQCGSLVLYQPAAGGSFKILISANYYLDNRTAQQIELSQSHQALIDEWAKLSATCPSFTWDAAP